MDIPAEIAANHDRMTEWRRRIHAHPETAFEEVETSRFVAEKLREFGLEVRTGLAVTGIVATLRNGEGPSIGLRADMDALDIHEENDFAHRSRVRGKMHACGHDGHTAILLGAADYLASTRKFQGTIQFIFQPAEENEGGGRVMVEEGLFEEFPMDAVFALHNWPGMPAGKIGLRPGPMMAAFDLFEIKVRGQGCHAAMPHMGTDSIVAASEIVMSLQRIVSRSNPLESSVVSVTQFHAGETWNIIPGEAILRGTVRAFREERQEEIRARIHDIAEGICKATDCEFDLRYEKRYPPTINTPRETEFAAQTASEIVGEENVIRDLDPSMGSEDFSFLLQKKPGCYVRLGNGPAEGGCILHSPHFDFNDEILPIGAAYFVRLAERFLNKA